VDGSTSDIFSAASKGFEPSSSSSFSGSKKKTKKDPEKKMEKMETDERSVEEKCKDAQSNLSL